MRLQKLLAATSLVVLAGCQNGFWSPFGPPGPKEVQQRRAVIHDPYPQNDIAPPLPDGRPRDYLYPPAESVRTRAVPDAMPWLRSGAP